MRFPKAILQEVTDACKTYADYEEVLNKLIKKGWTKIDWHHALTSPCGKYVFKRGYICDSYCKAFGATTLPPHAVPTKFIKLDRVYSYCSDSGAETHWILQPMADCSKSEEALAFFRNKLNSAIDLYEANVAHYKGKPVLIDW